MKLPTPYLADIEDAASNNKTILSKPARLEALLLISNAESQLALLDAKIGNIQTILDGLISQRTRDAHQIERYRSVIAPHRKFPPELLSEIFSRCIPGRTQIPSKLDLAPWSLTHVCSLWRQVALNTPDLWNNVEIHIDSVLSVPIITRRAEMATELLSRASWSPLSLIINSKAPPFSLPFSFLSTLIIPHAGRLRNISTLYVLHWVSEFLQLPPGSTDLLESVVFNDMDTSDRVPMPRNVTVFQDAPKLRRFSLWTARGLDLPTFRLPWSQLTDLNIGHLPAKSVVVSTALAKCTSLVRCCIGYSTLLSTNESDLITPVEIFLPNLRAMLLDMNAVHEDHIGGALIQQFVLPRLVSFELVSYLDMDGWRSEYTNIIAHSGRLGKLRIDISISPAELDKILKDNPFLTELIVADVSPLSSATLVRMGSGELVPRLTKLVCRADGWLLDDILEMLEDRRAPGNPTAIISDVVLVLDSTAEPEREWDMNPRFAQLEEAGLAISLCFRSELTSYSYFD